MCLKLHYQMHSSFTCIPALVVPESGSQLYAMSPNTLSALHLRDTNPSRNLACPEFSKETTGLKNKIILIRMTR